MIGCRYPKKSAIVAASATRGRKAAAWADDGEETPPEIKAFFERMGAAGAAAEEAGQLNEANSCSCPPSESPGGVAYGAATSSTPIGRRTVAGTAGAWTAARRGAIGRGSTGKSDRGRLIMTPRNDRAPCHLCASPDKGRDWPLRLYPPRPSPPGPSPLSATVQAAVAVTSPLLPAVELDVAAQQPAPPDFRMAAHPADLHP